MMLRRIGTVLLLGVFVALSAGCANHLFYRPDSHLYQTPTDSGLAYEDVTFESEDGTKLNGWFVPALGRAEGTVIHFHGNAQNMSSHFTYVKWLPNKGFNVFLFDYRGYGKSEGRPGRRGVYEDSVAAIRYVQSRPDVDPDRLLIFGQSLGGANAIAAVGNNDFDGVRAVAVEGTFYSYRKIVRDKLAQVPIISWLRWPLSFVLAGDSYSPSRVVDDISPTPLLFIHGTSDRVIPAKHSALLYERANDPKELWLLKYGRHIGAFSNFADENCKHGLVSFYLGAMAE